MPRNGDYGVVAGETGDDDGNKQLAQYFLSISLYRMKLYQASYALFGFIADNRNHLKFGETLLWLAKLATQLPEPADIIERVGRYRDTEIAAFDNDKQKELFFQLNYLLGRYKYRNRQFEEAIRLFGVVNTPRLVVKDRDIGEARFREGEMVLNILCVGSRDPRRFEAPNILDLDRKKKTHLTFSSGPHLCVGHVLGRAELRILTEEWVKRIPSFRAIPGEQHAFRMGTVMALESLPLEWKAAV